MLSVYLAGPEVFLPDAIEIGRQKKGLCVLHGFDGLYPLDNEIIPTAGEGADKLIYQANRALMECARFGICNLTPFRGASADAGTVFELGLMVGFRKPVFAYTNVASDYARRVPSLQAGAAPLRDQFGMEIEDFGNFDNLMLEWAVRESCGYPIVRHDAKAADVYRDLTGFEECLRLAAATMPPENNLSPSP